MKLPVGSFSFSFLPEGYLGIDIGTFALKVVELSKWANRKSLKSYGEMRPEALYEQSFRSFEKNSLSLSSEDMGRALKGVIDEGKMESRDAVFTIPDFSSFFTTFTLPPMTKDEVPNAVKYEARRHVPVPIGEVEFDWEIMHGSPGGKDELEVLMVAVPKEVVNEYNQIANSAGLNLVGLEAEVFALMRSSIPANSGPVILMDIGAQSTTISIIVNDNVKLSQSIDTAGNAFTTRIAKSLAIDYKKAEKKKTQEGMTVEENSNILVPLVDLIMLEIQRALQGFDSDEGSIEAIMIGGASAPMPGLREYIEENSGLKTEVVRPFRDVFYPSILEDTIQKIGPSYAVAVGAAMRGLK